MRIVLVSSEVFPYAKTGGLADVCGTLPLALERLGHEVSIIMPGYRCVGKAQPFSDRANVTVMGQGIKVYFLRHAKFFDRPRLYGDAQGDYPDNLDRFVFLCHEALRLIKDMGQGVDIIHCHDWQTALIPVLLKSNYADDPFFQKTRVVLTAHNLAYQGVFPAEDMPRLGVDVRLFDHNALEFYGKINLLKAGIIFADYLTTVSPQYAREIQTTELGCGLEGVIREKRAKLVGILNGLDYEQWDPEKDDLIHPQYSHKNPEAKALHKEQVQDEFRLPIFDDIPVFGFVGRLCYQKGLDLLESAFDDLMQRPLQLVFIGVGDDKYQKLLMKLARKYPQQCGAAIRYDDPLAHKVYAGSDFFLMPSVYEPCGLTQMISLRYGAIPIVSAGGGLIDTITDIGSTKKKGNGIVMSSYSVSGLLEAVDRASGLFHQKERQRELVSRVMACRWTWGSSAWHYLECYKECLKSE